MTPTQLRNSILQTAITGALVPQNPDEGSADALISQIEDEKRRLIADRNAAKIAAARAAGKSDAEIKKLKLEKYTAPTPVNPEDAPFEIPESWRWVRLGDMCEFLSRGKSPKYSDIKQYPVFAQKCNLKEGGISLEKALFLDPETLPKWSDDYKLRNGDVLINSTGTGTVCRTRLFDESCLGNYPFVVPDSHVSVVRTFQCIDSSFVCYYIMSFSTQKFLEDNLSGSTNQKELSIGVLQNLRLPLPPLSEQRRIVAKLEELLPLVEEYGEAQTELEALNAALPDKLKKSLLQQAITGRLVPQTESDGTAEQLLNNIIREKQKKIKAGIIKLSKPEMKVAKTKIEEEFDIPNTWKWCLLADVCRVYGRIGFRGYTKTDLVYSMEQGAISISPTNMVDNKMSYDKCTYISEEKYLESPEIMLKNGDVLIVKTGSSFGKTVLVSDLPWKATINPQLAIIKDIQIDTKYLVYVLQSPYAQRKYLEFVTGSAIPTFSQESLLGMSIPLPPLSEQRRIVAKLEEMFLDIEKLKS